MCGIGFRLKVLRVITIPRHFVTLYSCCSSLCKWKLACLLKRLGNCFFPRPNPESRFDATFNCIVIREASFVSDTRFQLFLIHECDFNTDFVLGYSQRTVEFVLSTFSLL